MGVLLAAYLASWLFRTHSSSPLDDWCVDGFEVVAAGLCIAKGLTRRPGRAMPLILGLALLSWAAGDIVLAIESLGGATPSTPSLADAFYVAFYPLAYVAIVIFMRGEVRRISHAELAGRCGSSCWRGRGVCGIRVPRHSAFHRRRHAGNGNQPGVSDRRPAAVQPGRRRVGDHVGRAKDSWILMAIAIAFNIGGDTANLFSASAGQLILGSSSTQSRGRRRLLLLSMSVWFPPRPLNPLTLPKPSWVRHPWAVRRFGTGCAVRRQPARHESGRRLPRDGNAAAGRHPIGAVRARDAHAVSRTPPPSRSPTS